MEGAVIAKEALFLNELENPAEKVNLHALHADGFVVK